MLDDLAQPSAADHHEKDSQGAVISLKACKAARTPRIVTGRRFNATAKSAALFLVLGHPGKEAEGLHLQTERLCPTSLSRLLCHSLGRYGPTFCSSFVPRAARTAQPRRVQMLPLFRALLPPWAKVEAAEQDWKKRSTRTNPSSSHIVWNFSFFC